MWHVRPVVAGLWLLLICVCCRGIEQGNLERQSVAVTPSYRAMAVSSSVESLGAVSASQLVSGLGFNLNPKNEIEFQIAAAAGATHVRFQCGWENTETQTPPPQNTNGATKYILPSDCQTGLIYAKKYGIHPTLLAAYGSPYHQILKVTLPTGAVAGSFTLNVQFASGVNGDTLANLTPFYDLILGPSNTQISSRHTYPGSLVVAVQKTDTTHATLTLSSALVAALPASTVSQFTISEYLYPPAATTGAADPSVVAYTNYARFLGQSISNAALTGDVEIWNEPVWGDDRWDVRANFYDVFPAVLSPGPQIPGLANFGFVAALQSKPVIPGVTYIWAGTNKSADLSVFDWRMLANTGTTFSEPAVGISSESFHPYGNNPEDSLWNEVCMQGTIKPYPAAPDYFFGCNVDINSTSNSGGAEQENLVQKSRNPAYGLTHSITETGFGLFDGDATHQARFVLRQYLGYQVAGVTPIDFYQLNSIDGNHTFTSPGTYTPLQSLTALTRLMTELNKIKGGPVAAYSLASLSSIKSYSGTYPLDTVHIVGSNTGDTANSELFTIWQRSNIVRPGSWGQLASPAAAPVTVAIPANTQVSAVVNLTTGANVAYTNVSQSVTLNVSDDPVEVMIVPRPVTVNTIYISPAVATIAVGGSVTFVCTAAFSNGASGACSFPVFSTSDASVASLVGNTVTTLKPGTVTISVSSGSLRSASSLTVSPLQATIQLSNLSRTYDGLAKPVLATTSPAGLAYIVSYSNSPIAPVSAGSYSVVAMISNPLYAQAVTSANLVISPALPDLTWAPAASQGMHGVAIGSKVLNASSVVSGSFSYTAENIVNAGKMELTLRSTLPSGRYTIMAAFRPSDTINFFPASRSISYSVVDRSIFIANQSGSVASFYEDGAVQSSATAGGSLGAVVDVSGNVWSISSDGTSLAKFDHTGLLLSTIPGMLAARHLAADGGGRIWVVSNTGAIWSLPSGGPEEFSPPILSAGLNVPSSVLIDASGSVWITDAGANSITEVLVGATPVEPPQQAQP